MSLQFNLAGHYLVANPYRIPKEIMLETILTSPLHQSSSVQCLQFFYHKGGLNNGPLSIYLRTNSTSRYLLLKLVGEEPHEWSLATTDLPPGEYRVEFHSTAFNYKPRHAIDDITVSDGPCDKSCKSSSLIISHCIYTWSLNNKAHFHLKFTHSLTTLKMIYDIEN